jgi:hypothetical protein
MTPRTPPSSTAAFALADLSRAGQSPAAADLPAPPRAARTNRLENRSPAETPLHLLLRPCHYEEGLLHSPHFAKCAPSRSSRQHAPSLAHLTGCHTLRSVADDAQDAPSSPPAFALADLSRAGQSPAAADFQRLLEQPGQTVSEIARRLKRRSICFCFHATTKKVCSIPHTLLNVHQADRPDSTPLF